VGGVQETSPHGSRRGRFSPRAQAAHHLGRRALLEEAAEDQLHTALHGAVRVLGHRAVGTARKPRRQCQRQVAALGLAQQASRQAPAQRVQFHFRDRALQAQEKAAVRRARIVDAVAIADEALPIAAQVEQRIPVRAVPREPGDLVAEDDPDLAERDARDQVLEAAPMLDRGPALAEVGIDDLDVGVGPAEVTGALAQRILQAQALLVGQHLVRRGLADVDHGLAAQMPRRDEVRGHGSSPGAGRRGRRGRRRAGQRAGLARPRGG